MFFVIVGTDPACSDLIGPFLNADIANEWAVGKYGAMGDCPDCDWFVITSMPAY